MDNERLTTKDFHALLQMAIDKYELDPDKTYLELTWWDKKFLPATCDDCNYARSEYVIVFGDTPCNIWHLHDTPIPCTFWINSGAVHEDQVVHKALSIYNLVHGKFMFDFEYVKFLISGSPVNSRVSINPFKTRIYKNWNSDTILCLYVDDRDSGEWQPFSNMTADKIELIDDSPNARNDEQCDG